MHELIIFLALLVAAAYAAVRLDEHLARRSAMARPKRGPSAKLISASDTPAESWWAQYEAPACWRKGLRPELRSGARRRRSRTAVGRKAASSFEVVA